MHILHTESSNGWGGQEIRILKESIGMRTKGHQVTIACVKGGKLAYYAQKEGFAVYEIDFTRGQALKALFQLCRLIKKTHIDVVNTHSSLDAWLGGIAARMMKKPVVRTRHLSTEIKGGLNARLLYNSLADFVVTTSSSIIPKIQAKAHLTQDRIACIATGVQSLEVSVNDRQTVRTSLNVKPDDILIGTVCVVRSWKGIQDMIEAAKLLRDIPHLKWVVVGGGYLENFKPLIDPNLPFIFTGHQENPERYLAAFDIFTLLSTAHEGISQASLQAGQLKKPLVTTSVGGLPEVCLNGITGIVVPPSSPDHVADAIIKLARNPDLRKSMGQNAQHHVSQNFTLSQTLESMEEVFVKVASR